MSLSSRAALAALWVVLGGGFIGGCASPGTAPVEIVDRGPNPVALWDQLMGAAVSGPPAPAGTPEERRPSYALDMATLHLALRDAADAAPTASREAAVHAAGWSVLSRLYPSRGEVGRAAYAEALAALPAGADRDRGASIGAERAAAVLVQRADDGRWASVPPFMPGTAPGAFSGANPINLTLPKARPFVIGDATALRGESPPALDSAAWRDELAETRRRGGKGMSTDARDDEIARFHTEPPPSFWTRNLNRFAHAGTDLRATTHLMARIWISQADASIACFAAKYHYLRWRPSSAIQPGDPAWTPRVPTPNHPEYPAAHACAAGALAETLALWYGTRQVGFAFDSRATNTSHRWATVDQFVAEVRDARIAGGMHFRSAMLAGDRLGEAVARAVDRWDLDRPR